MAILMHLWEFPLNLSYHAHRFTLAYLIMSYSPRTQALAERATLSINIQKLFSLSGRGVWSVEAGVVCGVSGLDAILFA